MYKKKGREREKNTTYHRNLNSSHLLTYLQQGSTAPECDPLLGAQPHESWRSKLTANPVSKINFLD